uniref:Uncharacterized protein n=1 Tax=Anguilla anguilla TaxID=7936 RepID=A0A0E9WFC4_ANGAN
MTKFNRYKNRQVFRIHFIMHIRFSLLFSYMLYRICTCDLLIKFIKIYGQFHFSLKEENCIITNLQK